LLGLAWATPIAAQVTAGASAVVAVVEHRVDAGFGVEVTSGTVLGGTVSGSLGRFSLTGLAQAGALQAEAGAAEDRDLAEVGVRGSGRVLDWLWLEAGGRWRAYASPIGRQRWSFVEVATLGRVPFAVPGLFGLGRVTFQPAVRVSGGVHPDPAIKAAVGVEYTPGPFGAELLYGRERYTFPLTGGARRLEQLSAITLRVRLGLRDRDARR